MARFIATAKAIRTAQRLKSSLVLQSPPTRTDISSVLTALATAIPPKMEPQKKRAEKFPPLSDVNISSNRLEP